MDLTTLGALGLGVAILLIILRIPIAFALGSVGLAGMVLAVGCRSSGCNFERGWKAAFAFISFEPYTFIANFSFVAIPLFLLMGFVSYHAGFTRDTYETARVWLGRMHGGLAIASVAGCAMFAAASGSSVATAAAMGRLAVPEMLRNKYDSGLATGVVAASGTLGSLIPPSILLILYGLFAEVSVGKLLVAAVIPGVLSALIYMAMIWIRCRINPTLAPRAEATSFREKFVSLKGTWSIITLFVLVMGGIYFGIVTPTEASAVGALGAILIAALSGRLTWAILRESIWETVRQSATLFALVLGAKIFSGFISLTRVASAATDLAISSDFGPVAVVALLCLVFVVLGTFMDPIGIILLTLPIVIPVIESYGLDLIWFGIIVVKLVEIGLITPPVGLNVFVLKGVLGSAVRLEQIFRGVTWFIAADIFTLALFVIFPSIVLFLPYLM
ncbi:MAG: TRAP transporter large permease [Sagittula sp.]|uniref:TRAP transporter large permease n=1 Tax=Sagittula sp. TaxID=2038081 RepID=UPI00405975D5